MLTKVRYKLHLLPIYNILDQAFNISYAIMISIFKGADIHGINQ